MRWCHTAASRTGRVQHTGSIARLKSQFVGSKFVARVFGCALSFLLIAAAGCNGDHSGSSTRRIPKPNPPTPAATITPTPPTATPTTSPSSSPTATPTAVACPSGSRELKFANSCDFPVWIGANSAAFPCNNADQVCPGTSTCIAVGNTKNCSCTTSADCGPGGACDVTGNPPICHYTFSKPISGNTRLAANGGSATVCLPVLHASPTPSIQWSGNVFGRTQCTFNQTSCNRNADCSAGTVCYGGSCLPNHCKLNQDCITELGVPSTCFDTKNSSFGKVCVPALACLSGDCGGLRQCIPGHGANGATDLAEFTLQPSGDHYDVSIINGVNVPMKMEPVPTATASPGANDTRYWCTAPGSVTDFGLGACNWNSLKPAFASNTSPPVITDYSDLMRLIVPPICSSTTHCPTGMTCSGSSGAGYCVPQGCSTTLSCPSGYTCSNPAGGVCYVACTTDSECGAQGTASACGIEAIPNSNTVVQTCGQALPGGWWTADEVCVASAGTYGAPFDCAANSNLFECAGINSPDCYNSAATGVSDCCGCPNSNLFTPNNFLTASWDTRVAAGNQCFDSNAAWIGTSQPWLVWLKSGCPTTYSFPNDDATSSFQCNGVDGHGVAYEITFCPTT
jgi:Thaumatin family